VHVTRPPETQDVWPGAHVLLHVSEHIAVGDVPAQLLGEVQGEVEAT
jgi:hypothetical protein